MTMYAIMKYESGLHFTGIVCTTEEKCKEYMKKHNWINPNAFEIVPCFYYNGDE